MAGQVPEAPVVTPRNGATFHAVDLARDSQSHVAMYRKEFHLFAVLHGALMDLDRLVDPAARGPRLAPQCWPTVAQAFALYALDQGGLPMELGDLANQLHCSRSNATELANNLVKHQWAATSVADYDKRITIIEITEEGEMALDRTRVRVGPLLAYVFEELSEEQRTRLGDCASLLGRKIWRVRRPRKYFEVPEVARRDPEAEKLRKANCAWRKAAECQGFPVSELRAWGYPMPDDDQ